MSGWFLPSMDHLRSTLEKTARFGRDPFALLIAILAGLGTAHVLVRTATYGAAVNTDSTLFLSTALNVLAGEGWQDFTGSKEIEWPPLFPLLLATCGWIGIDPLEAGRWINAIAFGLTIFAAGCWLRSNLRSQWLTLAATATLAASLTLTHFASYLLTEPLFVLFALLASIQLAAVLNRKTAWPPLWWAAVFTALAALTRYAGVALIGAGVLVLLPLARLRHTLVFGAVSSLPLLANWTVSETLAGDRGESSAQSLAEGLRQIVEVFRTWVVPPNAPDGLAYLLWLAVAAVVLANATVVLRACPAPASFRLRPVLPFGGFAVLYLVFTVATQGINSRYLLPLYVPLLLTAALLLDRFLSIAATGWIVTARYVVGLAALVHVGCSAHENLRLTAQAWRAGYEQNRTYNAASWQHSETLNYLRDHRIEGRIYSNHRSLAWLADRTAAPGKYQDLPHEMQWTEAGTGAYIVWFEGFHQRDRDDHDGLDLRLLPGVETVAELADGVVFRVTAAEPFDADRQHTWKGRYMELDELIRQAGERVVRSDWDVYRNGRRLTYLKKPCASADTQAKFVLHIVPADPADLPAHRKQYGFDNLDFYFNRRGVLLDGQCIAIAQLPDYAISHIRVGQWIAAENRHLWGAEFSGGQ